MVNASAIRNKLQSSIFSALGSSVGITSVDDTASSTNIYGEQETVYQSSTLVTGVPYSQLTGLSWESFGDLREGELDIVFPHDTTIGFNDKVSFDGTDYKVVNIEKYPLQDSNLAILVRVVKIL